MYPQHHNTPYFGRSARPRGIAIDGRAIGRIKVWLLPVRHSRSSIRHSHGQPIQVMYSYYALCWNRWDNSLRITLYDN